jgi:hypothetical protein
MVLVGLVDHSHYSVDYSLDHLVLGDLGDLVDLDYLEDPDYLLRYYQIP